MTETKRARGRPPVGPVVTGLRLSEDTMAEVEALAAAAAVTRSEMLRELIGEALAARRT